MTIEKNRAASRLLGCWLVLSCALVSSPGWSKGPPLVLNQDCTVSILNRTIYANELGRFAMPNVPSFLGQIRARATCIRDGQTITGQTDYFNVITNDTIDSGAFFTDNQEEIPVSLQFATGNELTIFGAGSTQQLLVTATYADASQRDVTASTNGINYTASNPQIASVDADGLVTAIAPGSALVSARKDGVIVVTRVTVSNSGDSDGDGLPDAFEISIGLDPLDPIDALEDVDRDGLSALDEFLLGTDVNNADSDGDGIMDGEETIAGADGFITNPLLADTDNDGISDGLEVLNGSDPTDQADGNLSDLLVSLEVVPGSLDLVFDTIRTETSAQLRVIGHLIDGSERDLTFFSSGTTYATSDITVASFGASAGQIFAGQEGQATITVSNGALAVEVPVTVESFAPTPLSVINLPTFGNNVDIDGDLAFVAGGAGGMYVIDTSDKAAPFVVTSLPLSGNANDIKVRSGLAYIAGGASGLHIVDVSSPATPLLISTVDTPGSAIDVVLQGSIAYVADRGAGIQVINIQNVNEPYLVGSFFTDGDANGLDVSGDLLVVSHHRGEAIVLDVANPQNPLLLARHGLTAPLAFDVQMVPPYAYIATSIGLEPLDLTVPSSPESLLIFGAGIWMTDILLGPSDFAFATQINPVTALPIFDVNVPGSPAFVAAPRFNVLGGGAADFTGLAADHQYTYGTAGGPQIDFKPGPSTPSTFLIGKYSGRPDLAGLPPRIELTSPTGEFDVVAGQRLLLSANASDDVAVGYVEFLVDGAVVYRDTSLPYQFEFRMPGEIRPFTFSARAGDLGSNIGETDNLVFTSQPDSDGDGLSDDREVNLHLTDPIDPDSDDDGLSDGEEVARLTDPNRQDTDGDGLLDGIEVANETDPRNPDITAPTVIATMPAQGESGVVFNTPIQIDFSEPLLFGTVSANTFKLFQPGNVEVAGNIQRSGDGSVVIFRPAEPLEGFTDYTFVFDLVKDLAGNPLAGPYLVNFSTGDGIDLSGPTVTNVNPQNNDGDVPTNAVVSVRLSEAVNPASVDNQAFYLRDTLIDQRIGGVVDLLNDNQTLVFVPNNPLPVGRRLEINLTGQIEDLFGNNLVDTSFAFTTRFTTDSDAPALVMATVSEGQTGVPRNARINVLFDEPVSSLSMNAIRLSESGTDVLSTRSISADGRMISIKPLLPMLAERQYLLDIGIVEDLSGNPSLQARQISFTSGLANDTSAGTITRYSPKINATDVPLDAIVEFVTNERIDPTTLTSSEFYLEESITRQRVSASIQLSPDGQRATLVPGDLLLPNRRYVAYIGYGDYHRDLAGNRFNRVSAGFTTGDFSAAVAPAVTASNISESLTAVPLNASLTLVFDQVLNEICVNSNTVTLGSALGQVPGSVSLSADGREITFNPSSNLLAGVSYSLTIDGVCGLGGQVLSGFSQVFTSGDAVDSQGPTLVDMFPAFQAIDVAVTSPLTLIFSEALDPVTFTMNTTLNRISVGDANGNGIAGNWAVSGNTAVFTPLGQWPGSTRISTRVGFGSVLDLAGNINRSSYQRYFDTEAVFDTVPPAVISVVPNDGAMDVNRNTSVVLTFSESLDRNIINDNNFVIYADGRVYRPNVARSLDNRTVTLAGTWPEGQPVAVVVTSDVRDLSGNPLADFVSTFSTGIDVEGRRPRVSRQLPRNGATEADASGQVVLYLDEAMDEAGLLPAFHVSENGVLVDGSTAVSDGRLLVFTPITPFAAGALVQVDLESTATDLNGNPVNAHQGSFRVAGGGGQPGVRPAPVDFNPFADQAGIPLNPQIQVAYDQPLDPISITPSRVTLTRESDGSPVPVSLALAPGDRVIELVPQSLLEPGTQYRISLLNGIRDIDGDTQSFVVDRYFTTASNAVSDDQAPRALAASPPNGTSGVPINPRYHLRYDEPMNSISFVGEANMDISFGADNREVMYSRYSPLPPNIDVTETVPEIRDVAGNPAVAAATTFRTGGDYDAEGPVAEALVRPTPNEIAPPNTAVRIRMNEVIDPLSLNADNLYVEDHSQGLVRLAGSASLENDGSTIVWIPDTALPVGREYWVVLDSVSDLSGNASGRKTFTFTTGFEQDLTPPSIVATTVFEGQTDVPTNALLRVRFDEAVDQTQVGGVRIEVGGIEQPSIVDFSADGRLLTLTPRKLLPVNTAVVFTVDGISDLAGNALPMARQVGFFTGAGVDVKEGRVVLESPLNGSPDVPRNARVEFLADERIDPTTLTGVEAYLQDNLALRRVGVSLGLSADGRRVTLTPDEVLLPNRGYRAFLSSGNYVFDLAGNRILGRATSFTTSDVITVAAPSVLDHSLSQGTLSVATNASISLLLSTPLGSVCVNETTAVLSDGINPVAGAVTLSDDGRKITFDPEAELSSAANYSLVLDGVCGVDGRALPTFSLSFTTGLGPDILRPSVVGTTPAHNASGVAVTTTITLEFDKLLDPLNFAEKVESQLIRVYGPAGNLAGDWTIAGGNAVFTPLTPLPGDTRIEVRIESGAVRDQAGNVMFGTYVRGFNTEGVFDTVAPTVVSVTPADGAFDIDHTTDIVLRFSESLDNAFINRDNFLIYANGEFIAPGVARSRDSRTVTLRGTWPIGAAVAVVVSGNVRDMSGNPLADFASLFSTAPFDTSRPRVLRAFPAGDNVDPNQLVVLHMSESMAQASVAAALRVSANGVLLGGSTNVSGDGRIVTFTPNLPFAEGALVQVDLESTATDLAGYAAFAYQYSFAVESVAGRVGEAPVVTAYSPYQGQADVPLNPVIQVAFDQALDPATLGSRVSLSNPDTGSPVPFSVSLVQGNRVIEVVPTVLLEANTPYWLRLASGIEDIDGDTSVIYDLNFSTGADVLGDNQPPLLLSVSPPDGAAGVPLNPRYHLRFDEAINSISFAREPGMDVIFDSGNRVLQYLRHAPLPEATDVIEVIPPVTDIAGNPSLPASIGFRTSTLLDTVKPEILGYQPQRNGTVPTNGVVRVFYNEAIDPVTVNSDNVYVIDRDDNNARVPGTPALAADGLTVVWLPSRPLAVGRSFSLVVAGVTDLSGNVANSLTSNFSSSFDSDLTPPQILLTSITEGQSGVPTNARLRVRFDEPIDQTGVADVRVTLAGVAQPVTASFNNDGTLLTLRPKQLLPANSSLVFSIAGIRDLAGNELVLARQVGFTTGAGVDAARGSVESFAPANDIVGAPLNTIVEFRLDERLDPASLSANEVYLEDLTLGRSLVATTLTVSADGRRVTITPDEPLLSGHGYLVFFGYGESLYDLAGNEFLRSNSRFTVGEASTIQAPAVLLTNLDEGIAAVPLNASVRLLFDQPMSAVCVDSESVRLSDGAAGVTGSVSLSADGRELVFNPDADLVPGTLHSLSLDGVCDVSGQLLVGYVLGFTTAAAADTRRPGFSDIVPAHTATGIAVSTAISATFDELLDPLGFAQNVALGRISVFTSTGSVAGDWSINGAVATFTPLNPLPGDTRVNVRFNGGSIRDQAGNTMSTTIVRYFDTESVFDTTAPSVVSITPNDGALDVNSSTDVVLTFSESLNSADINNLNFLLFADGNVIRPVVFRSIDNRTVTLSGNWPSAQAISVVVTSDVRDLSGNPLADFVSLFTTAVTDSERPTVTRQYPRNGAVDVSSDLPLVLYTSEPMNEASLLSAFRVSENGVLVDGTLSVVDERALLFTPNFPFAAGTLVEVDLDSTATDLFGNPITRYQGGFRTYATGAAVGTLPAPVAYNPASGSLDVPLNPLLQIAFDQTLNPATVTAERVVLTDRLTGTVVPVTISVVNNDRTVQVAPVGPLPPNTSFLLRLNAGIEDIDGEATRSSGYNLFFTTAADATVDNQQPLMLAISPSDGMSGVPLNPEYHVRYDEAINGISLLDESGLEFSIAAGNRELIYTRYSPLAANTAVTETVPQAADIAGNPALAATSAFQTGDRIDIEAPSIESYHPANSIPAPSNTVVRIEFSEPINPVSLTSDVFFVTGNGLVPGSISLQNDGRSIVWVPDAPLAEGQRYRVFVNGVTDLSGNRLPFWNRFFDVGFGADIVEPQIVETTVSEGQTAVPVNARLRVRFDEPIDQTSIDGVGISVAGVTQPVYTSFNSDGSLLTLTPKQLLPANSEVLFTIAGVRDLAGNGLIVGRQISFTTGSSVDIVRGQIDRFSPSSAATGLPLNTRVEMLASEPIDPATLGSGEVHLRSFPGGATVPADLSLAADGRRITLTPLSNLEANRSHSAFFSHGDSLFDLAGNELRSTAFSFTTGTDIASQPPTVVANNLSEGTTGVALNVSVKLAFDRLMSAVCAGDDSVLLNDGVANVEGNISLSANGLEITFDPVTDLLPNTAYILSLNGVCDVTGQIENTYIFGFTTGTNVDSGRPFITGITPATQSVEVLRTSTIQLEFSEPLDPIVFFDNVSRNRIRVYYGTTDVVGSWSLSGITAEFTPVELLPANTRINSRIERSALADQAGNFSTSQFNYFFDTGPL